MLSRVRVGGGVRHLYEWDDPAAAALLAHQRGRHELAIGQHHVQPPQRVELLPVGRHQTSPSRGSGRPAAGVQGVVDGLLGRMGVLHLEEKMMIYHFRLSITYDVYFLRIFFWSHSPLSPLSPSHKTCQSYMLLD